ncbi:MAG: elongation factor P [Elusimicrobiales bacterium]|nr:elongation factor P [Elusimicrobiales bacterium]
MILAVDLKNGNIFENENGQMVTVISYQHHRKSQSRAVIRVKVRNLETGSIIETAYRPEDKFKEVSVEKRPKTFLYADGKTAYFMDDQNYEQLECPVDKMGDALKFLTENMKVEGLYLNDKFFNIELPANLVLEVTTTVPGVKGDTVSNMMKMATLNTGLEIKVPLFIKEGDKVRVDTRTFEYVERVTQ